MSCATIHFTYTLYLTLESPPPPAPKPKTTSKGTKRKSSPSSSEKAKSSKKAKEVCSSSGSEAEAEEEEDELKDELKALAEEAADYPTEQVKGKKRRSQQEKDALPKKTPKTKAKSKTAAVEAEATEEETETKIEVDETNEKESEAAKVNLFNKKGQDKKSKEKAAKSTKKSSPKSTKKSDEKTKKSPAKSPEKLEKTPEKSPKKSPVKEKSPVKDKSAEKTPKAKLNPFAAMMGKSPAGQNTESPKSSSFEETVKKSRYDPIEDAIWKRDAKTPYLAFAKTLQAIEATSGRLKTIEILSNYFRSVIVLSPDDLLPSVYMCLNRIAPAYEGKELGIGETLLMKAIAQTTGRSVAQIKADVGKKG